MAMCSTCDCCWLPLQIWRIKQVVHLFLFHCLFPLGRFTDAKYQRTNDLQPLLCMCHRKSSSTRAAENMPCTIFDLSPVLALEKVHAVCSGFRQRSLRASSGHQAHYLVIPSNIGGSCGAAVLDSGVCGSTAVCQQGETGGSWPSSRA